MMHRLRSPVGEEGYFIGSPATLRIYGRSTASAKSALTWLKLDNELAAKGKGEIFLFAIKID